ncbi:MAG: hypothetical protein ACFFD1_12860, partial [Candidatus Thorarchaeota archaeon]
EPDLKDLNEYLIPNQKKFVNDLIKEIIAVSLLEDPISIIYRSKPSELYNECKKLLEEFQKYDLLDITTKQLRAISSELFKSGEVGELLSSVSVFDLRKSRHVINRKLENEFILRTSKRSPLIILLNTSLDSSLGKYTSFIETQTDNIFKEFDIASILGKIASALLTKEDNLSQILLSEFVRTFSMRFPSGLSIQAWKFTQTLFNIFSNQTGISIEEAIKKLDIAENHLETINSQLKEVVSSEDLQSLSFTITRDGDELIKFYEALQIAICDGIQYFFDEAIWSQRKLGEFSKVFAQKIEQFSLHAQHIMGLFSMLKIYLTQDYDSLSSIDHIPTIEQLYYTKNNIKPEKADIEKLILNTRKYISFLTPEIFSQAIYIYFTEKYDKEFNLFIKDKDHIYSESEKIYRAINDFFKAYNEGNTPPLLPKFPKVKEFGELIYSEPARNDIWKYYKEFYEKTEDILSDFKKSSSDTKKRKENEKSINKRKIDLQKNLETFKKRVDDIERKIRATNQSILKKIEKDQSKLLRDMRKAYIESVSPEFKVKQTNKTDQGFKFINIDSLKDPLNQQINNLTNFDSYYPATSYSVNVFAKLTIFNEVPKNLLNNAISEIINGDMRTSPGLAEFISSFKKIPLDSEEENDFIEKFKKMLKNNAEKKIKIIIESIIDIISNSFISPSLKTYPIFKEHVEIACFDIGEIPQRLIDKFRPIPSIFGEKIHITEIDKKYHLFLEIEEFPSSGSALEVKRAIGQAVWNEVIGDSSGFSIEILKMSSELLGELKRKKFQNLMETIYEFTL